jgi:hypothetical protein
MICYTITGFGFTEMKVYVNDGQVDDGRVELHAAGDGYTTAAWPDAEAALMELEAVVDHLRVITAEGL